jgi:hypothetical protein
MFLYKFSNPTDGLSCVVQYFDNKSRISAEPRFSCFWFERSKNANFCTKTSVTRSVLQLSSVPNRRCIERIICFNLVFICEVYLHFLDMYQNGFY